MASPFVVKQTRRLQHPTIPEFWIDVRVPLSARDLEGLNVSGTKVGMTFDLMASVIEAWADDRPVTADAVRDMDLDTYTWLTDAVLKASGVREDAEKKDSVGSSPPITELVAAGSPGSSPT